MLDLSPPPQTAEERDLHKAKALLFDALRLMKATPEHAATMMQTAGPYFRPIQRDLTKEHTALDILVKHVPAITDPTDATAVNESTPQPAQLAQHISTDQRPQQTSTDQQSQQTSTPQRRSTKSKDKGTAASRTNAMCPFDDCQGEVR
jgi:hypothetical protein